MIEAKKCAVTDGGLLIVASVTYRMTHHVRGFHPPIPPTAYVTPDATTPTQNLN